MAKYHKYVFDTEKREFIGAFEQMYQSESTEFFDSWHQEDSRQLQRKIDLALLEGYNFSAIVDLGCGKGAFTHLLKKQNNRVVGVDVSETALKIAKERFPDVEFRQCDLSNNDIFEQFLGDYQILNGIDLIFSSELLSYLNNWRDVVRISSNYTEYLLISLFIPADPIGFVKDESELVAEVERYFEIIEWISLRRSRFTIVLGRRRNGIQDSLQR